MVLVAAAHQRIGIAVGGVGVPIPVAVRHVGHGAIRSDRVVAALALRAVCRGNVLVLIRFLFLVLVRVGRLGWGGGELGRGGGNRRLGYVRARRGGRRRSRGLRGGGHDGGGGGVG